MRSLPALAASPSPIRLVFFFVLLAVSCVQAQLRIVDYNTSGARDGLSTVLAAIGTETIGGIAKPADIISLQEQDIDGSDTQTIVSMMNALYGAGVYASSTLYGASTGSGTQTVVYNTQSVQLISQTLVGTASTTGQPRQSLRAEFRPVGYDSSADFYIYADHFKSSNDATSAARRNVEAQAIRADADALGAGQNIIYSGDFNIYKSSEAMWTTMTAAGNGQAFDPINRVGSWSNNASFLTALTQSPVTTARYAGQTLGGLDDRFDWQMVTSALMDNEGMSIISGSYHTFGNDGSVALNGDITSGSATSLQSRLSGYSVAQATAVLTALGTASDHMPVVADYQVPAKMSVTLGTLASRVIRGATSKLDVTVSNSANVIAVNGADELDFTVVGSGAIVGTASGIDAALGTGVTNSLALKTSTVGTQSAVIAVDSSSQSVANGHFTQNLNYQVLDHAFAQFSGAGTARTFTADFGQLALDSGVTIITFTLANWISPEELTAGLDLDQVVEIGSVGSFSTTMAAFKNLAAGSTQSFTISLSTNIAGEFSAIYELKFSDEDLAGATNLESLWVQANGSVVAVPEPSPLLLFGIGLITFWCVSGLKKRQNSHH